MSLRCQRAYVQCIIRNRTMRRTQLRKADLNLLVVFTALAEERNGTRAAARLFLSQPALSRAMQRLRYLFHDDLLVRTPDGYESTPRGERLLDELTLRYSASIGSPDQRFDIRSAEGAGDFSNRGDR